MIVGLGGSFMLPKFNPHSLHFPLWMSRSLFHPVASRMDVRCTSRSVKRVMGTALDSDGYVRPGCMCAAGGAAIVGGGTSKSDPIPGSPSSITAVASMG